MNVDHYSMTIILHAGNAKGLLHEGLQSARVGEFEQVDIKIRQASDELLEAHKIQTQFLQDDAKEKIDSVSVILVHAQDHLMTVMSERDLIQEMIEMYCKQHEMNQKLNQLIEENSKGKLE